MTGQTVILAGPSQRSFAKSLIDRAPANGVVNVKGPTRTTDQNAKMWAMISDVSRANPNGLGWDTDTWKAAFMHAAGHEVVWQPGLSGQPFPAGYRSSKLTKQQMGELIDYIQAYGDQHGVRWTDREYAQ